MGALVLLGAWLLGIPLAYAALLAPVLVVGAGAVVGLFVFWARVAWLSLREASHPRLIIAGTIAGFAVLALLTVLGIKLPRE